MADQPRPPVLHPNPAVLFALALVHLEHNELREAHSRLRQADAVLGVTPDKLIGAVAGLAAAYGELGKARAAATAAAAAAAAAAQIIARARSGWSVPAWLDQRLSLVESRAYAAAGDIPAALATHSPQTGVPAAIARQRWRSRSRARGWLPETPRM